MKCVAAGLRARRPLAPPRGVGICPSHAQLYKIIQTREFQCLKAISRRVKFVHAFGKNPLLTQSHGDCIAVNDPFVGHSAVVAAALMHGHGVAFELHAWVVMNDHVHAVLTPTPATSLDAILHSWKGYSASQLMKSPNRPPPVWQRGWYDRVLFSPGVVAAATN